ncbi:MAG: hypothetical protein ABH827_01465 [bacterium]
MFKANRSLGKIALLLLVGGIFITSHGYGMKQEINNPEEIEQETTTNDGQTKYKFEDWTDKDANLLKSKFEYRELMKYIYHHLDEDFPNQDTTEWCKQQANKTNFIGLYFKSRIFYNELGKKHPFTPIEFKKEAISIINSLAQTALNTGIYLRVNNSNSDNIDRILKQETNAYNIIRLKFQYWFKSHLEKLEKKAPFESCLKECKKNSFAWAEKLTHDSLIPFIWVPYIKFKTSITWGITFEKIIPKEEIDRVRNKATKKLAIKNALELLILIFEKYEKCKNWSEFFELHLFDETIKTIYQEISAEPYDEAISREVIKKELIKLNEK